MWQFAKALNNRMKSAVHKASILHSTNFSSNNGILSMYKPALIYKNTVKEMFGPADPIVMKLTNEDSFSTLKRCD